MSYLIWGIPPGLFSPSFLKLFVDRYYTAMLSQSRTVVTMSAPPTSDVDIDPEWAAESNLGWILGVNGVFHVIAIGFVAARIYTRVFLVKTFGIDDALVIAATVSYPRCSLSTIGSLLHMFLLHYLRLQVLTTGRPAPLVVEW